MKVVLCGPAAVLACLGVLGGCSKFKGSTRLDMGPFAENTMSMLVEATRIVEPLPWNHLREYQAAARSDTLIADVETVRRTFRGIGMYSIQVVSLNSARLSDEARAEKLAEYLEDVLNPMLEAGAEEQYGLTRAQVESTLANIRASTNYLAAIGAADPVIYSIVQFSIARVDRVAAVVAPALEYIQQDVEAGYAATRAQIARLNAQEEADVRAFLALQDYRAGKGTKEDVVALDPLLAPILAGKDEMAAFEAAQGMLRERLVATDATRAQLQAKTDEYRKRAAEAWELGAEMDRRVRSARLMLVYWLRAHRNLAQGIQVPPAINIGEIVGSSAKKAVNTVVP
jgi:hypothetical protein